MNIKVYYFLVFTAISLVFSGCVQNEINNIVEPRPTLPPSAPSLTVSVDKTQSASPKSLDRASAEFKEGLVSNESLSKVEIISNGADGKIVFDSPSQRFELPSKPSEQFNETEERAKFKKLCSDKIPCIENQLAKAKEAFQTKLESAISDYQKNHSQIVGNIMDAFLSKPTIETNCTDIQEMMERLAKSSQLVMVFSDMKHDCRTPLKGLKFENKVWILLMPLRDEQPGSFGKRLAEVSAKFPNAKLTPVSDFNKEEMQNFLKGA